MSILVANLNHLYQKINPWAILSTFGILTFIVIKIIEGSLRENELGGFSAPIIWMFFVGIFVAALLIDVLSRPLSFCLP